MNRTTTPAPTTQDRDQRVLATLAQQRGRIDDVLVDDGHAPDAIDDQALGHCRVTVQTTLADGRPVSV
jgi:endonuclease YncB( thermonuclease family)